MTANDYMPLVFPYKPRPFFDTRTTDFQPADLGIRMSNGLTPGYKFEATVRHRKRANAVAFLDWFETQRGQRAEWAWHCPFYDDDFTCRFLTDEPDFSWEDGNDYLTTVRFVGVRA